MKHRCRIQIEATRRDYRCVRYPGRLADAIDDAAVIAHRGRGWWMLSGAIAACVAIGGGLWWLGTSAPQPPAPRDAPPTVAIDPPVDTTVDPSTPSPKHAMQVRPRSLTAFNWPKLRPSPNRTAKPSSTPDPAPAVADPATVASTAPQESRIAALRKPSKPTLTAPRLRAGVPKLRSPFNAS